MRSRSDHCGHFKIGAVPSTQCGGCSVGIRRRDLIEGDVVGIAVRMKRTPRVAMAACVAVLSAAVLAACLVAIPADAAPSGNEVLILGSSVSGGMGSREAQAVTALGLTPVIADDATWRTLTTAQFSSYRAVVLGDPNCSSLPSVASAEATVDTWGPAITGNVLINGTDPVFHSSSGGGKLTDQGIAFAVADAAKTGTYISLSCYYHGTAPNTPVPVLDGLRPGGFTVTGVGCYNSSKVVASHPALEGLTDADLSNWSCSVHEAFDHSPADFTVLALAKDFGSTFTASDGTVGTPYILARGAGLRSFPLSASPASADPPAGTTHTITAQLLNAADSTPVQGAHLRAITEGTFSLTLGCSTTLCTTDVTGQVAFTYSSATVRTDSVIVFRDANANGNPDIGEEQVRVRVNWTKPTFPTNVDYVALGDSFSSGEGTYDYDTNARGCHRGPKAWPRVLQQAASANIRDIQHRACTGATTPDLRRSRIVGALYIQPAQIPDKPDTSKELVTLTIGGNDVDFPGIVVDCYLYSCADQPTKGLRAKLSRLKNELLTRVYPRLKKAYPNARLLHVGYPRITPLPGATLKDCQAPRRRDRNWLDPDELEAAAALVQEINGTIATAVADSTQGIEYVNVEDVLKGHELCTDDPWVNRLALGVLDLPRGTRRTEQAHPNIRGQQAYSQAVANRLFIPTFSTSRASRLARGRDARRVGAGRAR